MLDLTDFLRTTSHSAFLLLTGRAPGGKGHGASVSRCSWCLHISLQRLSQTRWRHGWMKWVTFFLPHLLPPRHCGGGVTAEGDQEPGVNADTYSITVTSELFALTPHWSLLSAKAHVFREYTSWTNYFLPIFSSVS